MTLLAFLRHGRTAANRERRLQGRRETSLDSAGRAEVASWRLPEFARALDWWRSPLSRCAETAELLGLLAKPDPRLTEMDWGSWAGQPIDVLRAEDPRFILEEHRGLDLTPPNGESPRQMQWRIAGFFREAASKKANSGAISHKGVIRVVLSMATGWDMTDKPPVRLDWDALHLFHLDSAGNPRIERMNVRLPRE